MIPPFCEPRQTFSDPQNLMERTNLMKLTYLKPAQKSNSFDVSIGIEILFFRVSVTTEPGRSLLHFVRRTVWPGRSLLQFVTTNCLALTIYYCYLALNNKLYQKYSSILPSRANIKSDWEEWVSFYRYGMMGCWKLRFLAVSFRFVFRKFKWKDFNNQGAWRNSSGEQEVRTNNI